MLVEALYFIRIGSFGNIDWLSTKRQLSIHIDILVLIKEQLLAYNIRSSWFVRFCKPVILNKEP